MPPPAPRDSAAFELRDALAQPGCAICSLALRSAGRFLTALAYEQVNDLQMRAELRARGGLCNVHAYRWLREVRSVLGTALIYRDVLRSGLERLSSTPGRGRPSVLHRLMGRQQRDTSGSACPACRAQWEAEDRYAGALLAILREPTGAAAFEASDGVCLVHAALSIQRGGPASALILARARRTVEEVVATLDEVIRKEDYRFRGEARSELERTAPTAAVATACGADGLVAAPIRD